MATVEYRGLHMTTAQRDVVKGLLQRPQTGKRKVFNSVRARTVEGTRVVVVEKTTDRLGEIEMTVILPNGRRKHSTGMLDRRRIPRSWHGRMLHRASYGY